MTIVDVKVHPAIGIARLGDSPHDFFIGPEKPWQVVEPPGGYKDAQCRIKRQAARFRLYAYHDDGTVSELTAADAEIQWTVELANKKATHAGNSGSAAQLTIDPGPRTLHGAVQHATFDSGTITLDGATTTVPLGEVRTDAEARLLVLGGFGKSASPAGKPLIFPRSEGWYDDVSDGPVNAHVKITATGDEFDAVPGWVIVGPPKFAPALQSPVTLFDRIFAMAAAQGWVAGPADPSYTNDIYPILQRARDIHAVRGDAIGEHTWADPVYNPALTASIFAALTAPGGGGGTMPDVNDSVLTPVQYAVMQAWKNGTYTQDWPGAPPQPPPDLTPAGLDSAALTNCVGAAFFPGIEAGGIVDGGAVQPIIDHTTYVGASDPLRLNAAALSPGDITQWMALPWQNDFFACQDIWWPVPRPDEVTRGGVTNQSWTAGLVPDNVTMVSKWSALGFVVKQGSDFVEVERCDVPFIALLTPTLNFQDVPQGPMGMSRTTALAVEFEVESSTAVTLEVKSGDGPASPRLTLAAPSVTVGPTAPGALAIARLWVEYQTGPVGEHISDHLTVTDAGSGATWMVAITANTVARKTAVAALVLDRSGSMADDRGDGQSKHDSVVEASSIMVDVMLEGDAIGVVAFNNTAATLEGAATLGPAGNPFDSGRLNTKNILAGPGLTPAGSTSIGAGIQNGRTVLNGAGAGFAVKALVVLTDGEENTPPWIADVAPQIDDFTYSVGLGTPQNTSAAALQAISGNHGGYLLLTGAISGDNRFILTKYFLQILAGISNAEIVLDPQGVLLPGQEQAIPFPVTEADSGMDVILLTPFPQYVNFRLQAPTGAVIDPGRASPANGIAYSINRGNSYYRVVLPQILLPGRLDQEGTWKALLSIGRPSHEPERSQPEAALLPPRWREAQLVPQAVYPAAAVGQQERLPYSLVVHAYSNLSFEASLVQSSNEPGAHVTLHGTLAESGIPPRPGARVWAEVTRPNGTTVSVVLAEAEPGQFSGSFVAALPGIYRCRVRARGHSRHGNRFQREQTLTAAVWRGGDQPPPSGGQGPDKHWCDLLRCLLASGALTAHAEQIVRQTGLDVAELRRCIDEWCRPTEIPER
jgi:hypothetical protein